MRNAQHEHGRVSAAIQDYVKCCYRLEKRLNRFISLSELAKAMEVAPPSATNMVKRMEGLGLIKKTKTKLQLTKAGTNLALEVIPHHRLLETFLVNEMGMNWAEAHEEAEILEHYISERFEALLDKRLAQPSHDPHGEPIPAKNGKLKEQNLKSLLEYPEKSKLVIGQVQSRNCEMLEYLQKHNLTPGTKIQIQTIAPFDGPISLKVNNKITHIGQKAAHCIFAHK